MTYPERIIDNEVEWNALDTFLRWSSLTDGELAQLSREELLCVIDAASGADAERTAAIDLAVCALEGTKAEFLYPYVDALVKAQ